MIITLQCFYVLLVVHVKLVVDAHVQPKLNIKTHIIINVTRKIIKILYYNIPLSEKNL